ncbi:MAG: hypothetical protein ACI9AP_000941, partial [Flavobacteriales bacterium]
TFSTIAASPILCSCKIDIPYIHVHNQFYAPAKSTYRTSMYITDFMLLQQQVTKKNTIFRDALGGASF